MHKLARTLLLGAAVSAFALAGCTSTNHAKDADGCACGDPENCAECSGEAAATMSAAGNDTCPFSGEPVSADVQTVSFQGKEIGFCCNGCAGKFAKMTDAEKASLLGG